MFSEYCNIFDKSDEGNNIENEIIRKNRPKSRVFNNNVLHCRQNSINITLHGGINEKNSMYFIFNISSCHIR